MLTYADVCGRLLGDVAGRCQAYAKSLHYKEMEFVTSPATYADVC